MTTPLKDLPWSFDGPGSNAGVFSSLSLKYPSTLTIQGNFEVEERILNKSGTVNSLGLVRKIPFNFSPEDFAPDVPKYPRYNIQTGQLRPGVTVDLADLMEQLYSVKRGKVAALLAAEAAAQAAAEAEASPLPDPEAP